MVVRIDHDHTHPVDSSSGLVKYQVAGGDLLQPILLIATLVVVFDVIFSRSSTLVCRCGSQQNGERQADQDHFGERHGQESLVLVLVLVS